MSRAGRKREKAQQRNGVPIASVTAEPNRAPNDAARAQPHRRFVCDDSRHDERAETALGRYAIDGVISPAQYAAGRRLAGIVARWQASIDAPRPAPSIAGYMQPGNGHGEADERAEWELREERDNALQALHGAGATAVWAVKQMTIHEQPCPGGAFRALARGLTRLVEHFRREDEKRRNEAKRIRSITRLYQTRPSRPA